MKIVDFILEKYIFLAVSTAGLTMFSYQSFGKSVDFDYVSLVGLGTLLTYNYHEWLGKSMNEILQLLRTSSGFLLIGLSILMLYLTTRIDWTEALILLISGVLSMLYFIGLRGVWPTLRSSPWGKVIVIGLVFALSTIVVPSLSAGYSILAVVLLGLARLLYIMALAISFDIGDQLVDNIEGSKTLPTDKGVVYARWVGILGLILAAGIEGYWAYNFLIELPFLIALFITYFLSGVLILRSHRLRPRWYYLAMVDGMIGLPYILAWIL